LLELRFEHLPLSVFRSFPEFAKINPVVKAPSLVCDDGEVLMDSSLILEYAEAIAKPRTLLPADSKSLQHDLHLTGFALAATDKSVQVVYERQLRPPEKVHEPWLERVVGQVRAAYAQLEQSLARQSQPVTSATIRRSGVAIAVGWTFTQKMVGELVSPADFPHLAAFAAAAEELPEFRAAPHGVDAYRARS
jgi:glutathione S-transferase